MSLVIEQKFNAGLLKLKQYELRQHPLEHNKKRKMQRMRLKMQEEQNHLLKPSATSLYRKLWHLNLQVTSPINS